MVAAGEFREDLFYRLAVVPLHIPPLRDRAGDAARLTRHFVEDCANALARRRMGIDDDAVSLLAAQPWPGNVRQLQNFVERLVVLADQAPSRGWSKLMMNAPKTPDSARQVFESIGAPADWHSYLLRFER